MAVWLRPPRDAYRGVDLEMAASASCHAGCIEEDAGHARLARHFYGRAVALNPDHGGALARCRGWRRRPARGAAAGVVGDGWKRRAPPRPPSATTRRAICWRRPSRLEPDWALPHQFLANVAFLEGNRREAVEHLERAVELAPLDPAMRANLKNLRGPAASVISGGSLGPIPNAGSRWPSRSPPNPPG